jgi:hypothetical protein
MSSSLAFNPLSGNVDAGRASFLTVGTVLLLLVTFPVWPE